MPGTPPPIGVIGVIHFDIGIFQDFGEIVSSELVNDAGVIAAVRAVQGATTSQERIGAITQLMERLE